MCAMLIPLRTIASMLQEILFGRSLQPRSAALGLSNGAVALTLIMALLVLVTSSMAATMAPARGGFFMLPWKRSDLAPTGAGTSWYKGWSGLRVPPGSDGDRTLVTMVYYHEQTIAVVELGPKKTLRNCELIEVYEPLEAEDALRNLTSLGKPYRVTFREMIDLMTHCHELENPLENTVGRSLGSQGRGNRGAPRGLLGNAAANPTAIFNGIVPGTKWCGTGDIAATYYDLGPDSVLDRCCRTHDLCPVKVRAYQTRYNLTNSAIFSKSHCECDDILFRCLKQVGSSTADVMGNIYFNIVQVPCLESDGPSSEDDQEKTGAEPMRFSEQHYAY